MRISDWSSDVCSSDLIAGWRTPGEKLVAASIIEHRLGMSSATHRPSEREQTLLMLFRNAAAVVIATMTVLIVLSHIGINIGPLIAGADRKSTRLNSSHLCASRMPSSA